VAAAEAFSPACPAVWGAVGVTVGGGWRGCARAWGADTWPERVLEPTQIVEYGGVEIPDGAPPRALREAP